MYNPTNRAFFPHISLVAIIITESNSCMNRINCSQNSADLLRKQWPDLDLRERGELSIKGKGQMNCYWVNESIRDAKTDSLERLEAKRKLRILESSIHNWGRVSTEVDVEKGLEAAPEQAPVSTAKRGLLATLTEGSCEFSSRDLGADPIPEQAPVSARKLATLAESSSELKLGESSASFTTEGDIEHKLAETEGSAEFVELTGNLQSRLGRVGNKQKIEYFV